jgi:hypothetical protein
MWRKLSIFLILFGSAISLPVRVFAQTQSPVPTSDYWFGPGFMWVGGWFSIWWICPLMMVVLMLAMMFACRFMRSWPRD